MFILKLFSLSTCNRCLCDWHHHVMDLSVRVQCRPFDPGLKPKILISSTPCHVISKSCDIHQKREGCTHTLSGVSTQPEDILAWTAWIPFSQKNQSEQSKSKCKSTLHPLPQLFPSPHSANTSPPCHLIWALPSTRSRHSFYSFSLSALLLPPRRGWNQLIWWKLIQQLPAR